MPAVEVEVWLPLEAAAAEEALSEAVASVVGWLELDVDDAEEALELEELADELAWANTTVTSAKAIKPANEVDTTLFITPYYIPLRRFVKPVVTFCQDSRQYLRNCSMSVASCLKWP